MPEYRGDERRSGVDRRVGPRRASETGLRVDLPGGVRLSVRGAGVVAGFLLGALVTALAVLWGWFL